MTRSEWRLVRVGVAALVLACCLGLSFVGAFHKPNPQSVPLALVAPPAAAEQLHAALAAHAPGALSVRSYADTQAATDAVRDRAVDGALVVGPTGMRLIVASAGGSATEQFLTDTFQSVAASSRQQLSISDVVPLPSGDPEGLSAFFITLAMLIASLGLGIGSAVAGGGSRRLVHVGALVGFCVLIGLGAALIVDPIFGALTRHFAALAGIATLYSLAVAVPTAASARVRAPLAAIPVLLFLVIGIPASGGPAGMARFMPGFFRWFASWLPASRTLSAVTNTVYFGGHMVAANLWVLAAWAAAGVAMMFLPNPISPARRSAKS